MTHFTIKDYQLHTVFSDGSAEISEMVENAVARGATKICVTDHAHGWQENGTEITYFGTPQIFKDYLNEIERLKSMYRLQGVEICTGLEVEVSLDGTLRLAPGILKVISEPAKIHDYVDIVVGVIHSESLQEDLLTFTNANLEKLHMDNVLLLIANELIDVWGHPFQALHGQLGRQYTLEERSIINDQLQHRNQSDHPLAVEYNLNPMPHYEQWSTGENLYQEGAITVSDNAFYMDLPAGTPVVVSSDAHSIAQLERYDAISAIDPDLRQRLDDAL